NELLYNHWDFEFGDETLITKYGAIEDGEFRLGKAKYRTIIIPPSITWQKKTLKLLKEYLEQDGKVIMLSPFPRLVDGEKNPLLDDVISQAITMSQDSDKLNETLNGILSPRVKITDSGGANLGEIWYHYRRCNEKHIYFLTNTNPEKAYNAIVQLPGQLRWEEWDPLSGGTRELNSLYKNGWTQLQLRFTPAGSFLLVGERKPSYSPSAHPPVTLKVKEIELPDKWDYERLTPNALLIDYCKFKVNGKQWSRRLPVWQAFQQIKEHPYMSKFTLQFDFEIGFDIQANHQLVLVCETPDAFQIFVNDKQVHPAGNDYLYDMSFKKIDILESARKGNNTVRIHGTLQEDTELENIFIAGNFAVKQTADGSFILLNEPTQLSSRNLVQQGYPFFAGAIVLSQSIKLTPEKEERIFLAFEQLDAIVAEVMINDKSAGVILWEPYQVEITGLVKPGNNKIAIKLVNSLHNLLGPLHHQDGEVLSVGPHTFTDLEHWTDTYNFVPLGFATAKIIQEHNK
ncbi:hypothetical protein J7M23_11380, partial [Candidatus Sumerlaeota bacterium]|nr:hypothetical protein [Candidatus Sumerlaeota bacterium]